MVVVNTLLKLFEIIIIIIIYQKLTLYDNKGLISHGFTEEHYTLYTGSVKRSFNMSYTTNIIMECVCVCFTLAAEIRFVYNG